MKILWLSWKDIEHPHAGGAEVVGHNIRKRLAHAGHEVILFADRFQGSEAETTSGGYRTVREGRYSVYWKAYRYYRTNLSEWPDVIVDEMNTLPFFARYYARCKSVMMIHQLAREIWFYQTRFPISLLGYLLEPLYVRALSGSRAITVSESTKADLVRYGFDPAKISIISEGIEIHPLPTLEPFKVATLYDPVFLVLGSIRPMKRTLHAIEAYEILADKHPTARLIVAGSPSGAYGQKVLTAIRASRHTTRIEVHGRVSLEEKVELMQKAHVQLVASLKEGWGLIVTEAASQGTPTVVYDVDGLRDAVFKGETGVITATNTPVSMAEAAYALVSDPVRYADIRNKAWNKSKEITFEKSFEDFSQILKTL